MRDRPLSLVRAAAVSLLPLVIVACGTPPAATSPTTAPSASASTSAASSGPALAFSPTEDRSPATAPPSTVVEFHVSSPREISRALKSLLPTSMESSDKVEARSSIASMLGSKLLAQIVDIDKSVDLTVALRTPEMPAPKRPSDKDDPVVATAYPIEAELTAAAIADRLKGTFRLDAPDKHGVIKLTPTRQPKWDDPDLGSYHVDCAIFPALGDAPHRLVCTDDPDRAGDLAILGPWLTRGVTTREAPRGAVRIDGHIGVLKKVYGKKLDEERAEARMAFAGEIRVGKPELDAVLKRLGTSVVDELFDVIGDLDEATWELGVTAEGMNTATSLSFVSNVSWTSRWFQIAADLPPGAPESFGKLPMTDAFLAGFARMPPGADVVMQPWEHAALDLISAAAADYSVPKADRDLALDLVKQSFRQHGDVSFVEGLDYSAKSPLAKDKHAKSDGDLEPPVWTIAVADREPKQLVDEIKAAEALVARAAIAKLIRQIADKPITYSIVQKAFDAKVLPPGAFGSTLSISLDDPSPSSTTAKGAKGPKDAKPSKDKAKEHALTMMLQLLVMPGGPGKSWMGSAYSGTPAALVARVQKAMAGSGTLLGSRQGLDILVRGTPMMGFYFPLDSFGQMLGWGSSGAATVTFPDGGRSGIACVAGATKKGPVVTATFGMSIPRDTFTLIDVAGAAFDALLKGGME